MRSQLKKLSLGPMVLILAACGGAKFNGNSKPGSPPEPTAAPPSANNQAAAPLPTPVVVTPTVAPQNNGIPTSGPESDLTVGIFDTDSKMDVFNVRNSKTNNALPITWTQGTQTVKSACSPSTPTLLTITLHTAGGLLSSPVSFSPGSCNAPVTQTSSNTVDMTIDRDCTGTKRAHVTFQCAGSTDLKIQ